jgi:hypothetical protein
MTFTRDFRLKLCAALLIGGAIFAMMPLHRMMTAQNDFVHWYVGGSLFGTPDLHLEEPNQRKQVELIGGILTDSYFIRPTFYGLLLKPLTWFSYSTAYVLFQIFSLLCIALFLRTYARDWPDLLIYAAMSVPLISNFVNGQDVSLLLAFCTVSLILARRDRDFASGLVFSLCAIKFHLFILMPVAMVAKKRWRIFWGAVAGEIVLFLLGLTGGGWKVFLTLVDLLRRPENHPYPHVMPNLRGLLKAFGAESLVPLLILFALVLAAAVYLIVKSTSYEEAFAYSLMAGLLVNFHAYIQDPVLLLLAGALLFRQEHSKAFRLSLEFLLLPIVYILLLTDTPLSGAFAIVLLLVLGIGVWEKMTEVSANPFARRTAGAGAGQVA